MTLSFESLPSASRNMVRVDLAGACSRKSKKSVRPSAMRTRMWPPPPSPVMPEWVTPRTKPMAMAASMALPPALRMARPASVAWGPMILGYRHPAIVAAMRRQAELPADYGAQHELEFLVSEQIQKLMPCAELVQFTSSGSEACQIAFRLARAFTGRDLILKFEGHYHGWMDGALVSYKPAANQVGAIDSPN